MIIMMLAWRVLGRQGRGFKCGNLWTTPVGWNWFCYFQFSPLTDRRFTRWRVWVVSAPPRWRGLVEARRRYIITQTRVPTKMLPFTASQPADRKNALRVPFRRVTIFNIPIVPFQQGKFRVRIVEWRTFFHCWVHVTEYYLEILDYQARIASWWISLVVDQLSFKSSIWFTHN